MNGIQVTWIVVVSVIIHQSLLVMAYSSGASPNACESMKPGHGGANEQASTVPYELTPDNQILDSGEVLNLELKMTGSSQLKGFMVHAYESGTNQRIGAFSLGSADANAKGMTCGGITNSVATHKSSSEKTSVNLPWKAPDLPSGTSKIVEFKFSAVKDYNTFWIQQSATNTVRIEGIETTSKSTTVTVENDSGSEAESEPEGEAEVEPEGEAESEASKHSDYDGCNQNRGCFGLQEGCTSSSNCPAMVTYKYLQDLNQFQFKLHIKSVDSGRYVAVGFSNDPKMGDDLVIFCSTEDGASPQLSWNEGKSNKLGVQGLDLLQKISVSAVDGAKSCEFTLPNELKFTPPGGSEQKSYDIGSGKYHMLLSIGPFASSSGNLNYHNDRIVSAKPLNLKSVESVELQRKGWMAQIHGFLMILAWMGSAASGMMLARYFKKTWRSVRQVVVQNDNIVYTLHNATSNNDIITETSVVQRPCNTCMRTPPSTSYQSCPQNLHLDYVPNNNISALTTPYGTPFESPHHSINLPKQTNAKYPENLHIDVLHSSISASNTPYGTPCDFPLSIDSVNYKDTKHPENLYLDLPHSTPYGTSPSQDTFLSINSRNHADSKHPENLSTSEFTTPYDTPQNTPLSIVNSPNDFLFNDEVPNQFPEFRSPNCILHDNAEVLHDRLHEVLHHRETEQNHLPFDKDLWFRLHQLFMSFTVLSTIAGIVVIAIDRGNAPLSLEQVKKNPHPALGMVCIITAFIQPLMALLRPHPESDKRWIFNVAHWLFGNISYTFAIAAIFKAMEYSELEMPENVVYLLIAYVIVHVLIHFTLTGQRWCSEKNIENQVKDIDNNEPLDAPGSGFRKSMAFFYIGFVFIISFSLIGWIAYVHCETTTTTIPTPDETNTTITASAPDDTTTEMDTEAPTTIFETTSTTTTTTTTPTPKNIDRGGACCNN